MGITKYEITRAEVDRLATQWCRSKNIVVILDDIAKQFACDVSNKVLRDFVLSIAESQAAKKAAVKGEPAPTTAPAPETKKSSLVLTDI